jgi:guanine nucleotide-binding protein G(i) subunit alpha
MKLIHDGGYSREERETFKEIIFSNTVQSMRVIIEAMENMGVPYTLTQNKHHSSIILDLPPQIEHDSLPEEVTAAIKSLWKDENLLNVFGRSREYQLNDSAK